MRMKSTPFKVIDKASKKKKKADQHARKTNSSGRRRKKMQSKNKRKTVSMKDEQSLKTLPKIKSCSVVLTRCDLNKTYQCDLPMLDPETPAPVSQNTKTYSSMNLRSEQERRKKKAKDTETLLHLQVLPEVNKMKKKSLRLSGIISNIAKRKKAQAISTAAKRRLVVQKKQKLKRRKNTRNARKKGSKRLVPKNLSVVEKEEISSVEDPNNLICIPSSSGFEYLVHSYAKPTDEQLKARVTENTPANLVSDHKNGNSCVEECFYQNGESGFSSICKVCGKGFNISMFIQENQSFKCINNDGGLGMPGSKNVTSILRPKHFNSLTPCNSGKLPTHLQSGQYFHCFRCPMMYIKMENLQSHEKVHKFCTKLSTICKYCFQVFNSKWGVIRHVQRLHAEKYREEFTSFQKQPQNSLNRDVPWLHEPPYMNLPERLGRFLINVPNVTIFTKGNKIEKLEVTSYSSYLVQLNESTREHTSLPYSDLSDEGELHLYINTNQAHHYPTDEHNYASIPPGYESTNMPSPNEPETGIEVCTTSEKDQMLVYSNVASHYIDGSFSYEDPVSDISHVEEVAHKSDEEEEDFCISLSPDIVMYISQETGSDQGLADTSHTDFSPQCLSKDPLGPRETISTELTGIAMDAIESGLSENTPQVNFSSEFLPKESMTSSQLVTPKKEFPDALLVDEPGSGYSEGVQELPILRQCAEGNNVLSDKEMVKGSSDSSQSEKLEEISVSNLKRCLDKQLSTAWTSEADKKSELPGDIRCWLCNDIFPSELAKTHYYNCWKTKVKITCGKCGAKFSHEEMYCTHVRKTPKCHPNFKCKLCLQPFSSKTDLTSHMTSHFRWQCNMCSVFFINKYLYEEHQKRIHGMSTGDAPVLSSNTEDTNKQQMEDWTFNTGTSEVTASNCKGMLIKVVKNCETSTESVNSPVIKLESDNSLSHTEKELTGKTEQNGTSCEILKKDLSVTGGASELNTFEEICEVCLRPDGLYHCNMCNTSCEKVEAFREHIKSSHVPYSPLVCPMCPAWFHLRSKLNNHIELHSDEESIICAICSWPFSAVGNIISHFMVTHTKPQLRKPRKHVCVFSFRPSFHNNQEMILYKCNGCDLSYLQRH